MISIRLEYERKHDCERRKVEKKEKVVEDGTTSAEIENALHPNFLYEQSSADGYVPPPRIVEFYAPW